MTGGGAFGGGVIFVVAALLWGAVLVPGWMRRREFRAAERNAMRLQRTLRILAETSEVPAEVRAEATAREALAHEKLVRSAERRQAADRETELAEARAAEVRAEIRAQRMRRKQAALARSARLRRPAARRMRAFAALVAVLCIAGALVGTGLAIAGLGTVTLVVSALGLLAAGGALVLLAPGRVRLAEIPEERVAEPVRMQTPAAATAETEDPSVGEAAAAAAHAAAQAVAAARIERAKALARARERARTAAAHAAAAEARPRANQADSMLLDEARAQVAAARTAEVKADATVDAQRTIEASVRTHAPVDSTADRLRRMGVIGDTAEGMPDLDAVLRRRRAAG